MIPVRGVVVAPSRMLTTSCHSIGSGAWECYTTVARSSQASVMDQSTPSLTGGDVIDHRPPSSLSGSANDFERHRVSGVTRPLRLSTVMSNSKQETGSVGEAELPDTPGRPRMGSHRRVSLPSVAAALTQTGAVMPTNLTDVMGYLESTHI